MARINTGISPFAATAYHAGAFVPVTDQDLRGRWAWHDTSDTIAKIAYPMIGDPTGRIARNFEVMREEQGLADRATFLIDLVGRI